MLLYRDFALPGDTLSQLVGAVGARRISSKCSKLELHCFGLVLQSGRNRAKESHLQTHKRNVLGKVSVPIIDASQRARKERALVAVSC